MNNEEYFNYIKTKFINLANFTLKQNYLILTINDKTELCPLTNINLKSLDQTLFNNSPQEIIYIIKNIFNMINKPEELDKKIIYMQKLLEMPVIAHEQSTYINNYMLDFYTRKNIMEKFTYSGDKFEINKMMQPIHICYDETNVLYHNPGATMIRQIEEDYSNKALENGNEQMKAYVRELKSKHNVVATEPPLNNVAGFMNATFIFSIVSTLGITIAAILYFLAS